MWISQTYLGSPDPNSKVFLYYFWEDYARQKSVPPQVLEGLSDLGYDFRDKVSAYAPMESYLGMIREEMRDKFDRFWRTFAGKTPGIFLCRKSLRDFNPETDEWLFFEISDEILRDKKAAVAFFAKIHETCREIINHHYEADAAGREKGLLETLYDSAQLKVTFMGAGIDFKPMLDRFARRRR
jgi:hypothetical protein